jgi:hypothetical protein
MKKVIRMMFVTVGLLWIYGLAEIKFEPHIIHEQGGNWGKTGVADFDNDGHLDFAAGVAGKAAYWFRNPGSLSGKWERYDIDPQNGGCVGGDAADVDGDGLADWISHGIWYRNNKENPGESFDKFTFADGGTPGLAGGCHDFVAVDIDGDGNMDAMNHGISWWRNPGGENATQTWERTDVDKAGIWGGVAPNGFGDIDGDGETDIVGVKKWYENVDGKGKEWKPHTYTTWGDEGKYGWEFRTVTADFDGDGDTDISVAEGDANDGTAAWFENVDGKGTQWKDHPLPFEGVQGDMHSNGAQDFDNDGDIDIHVPRNGGGEGNEWSLFENVDGKGNFQRHQIYKGFGAHETVYGDFDSDGDIDIVSKCWCGNATIVLLENKTDPPKPVSVRDPLFRNEKLENPLSFSALVAQRGGNPELEVVSNASGRYTIELYNTKGKRLAGLSGTEQARGIIPLRTYRNGMYILRLTTRQGAVTKKLMLSR